MPDTPTRSLRFLKALPALALLAAAGCSSYNDSLHKPKAKIDDLRQTRQRRQQEAEDLYQQALAALARDNAEQARGLLENALELNPYHGAAHNDLGVILFRKGDLHQAATHFDSASKNLLGDYQPLYNLGRVWETAGRLKAAAEAYAAALKLAPQEIAVKENLAAVYIRMDINHRRTVELLEESLPHERRAEWQQWIRLHLLRLKAQPAAIDKPQSQPAKAPH